MAEWQATMTQAEFQRWAEYYVSHPFDDLHRYHRPAAMVSGALGGGDVQAKLNWLQPEPIPADMTEADVRTMRAFGLKPSAKG